jgi:hypothetical protein
MEKLEADLIPQHFHLLQAEKWKLRLRPQPRHSPPHMCPEKERSECGAHYHIYHPYWGGMGVARDSNSRCWIFPWGSTRNFNSQATHNLGLNGRS